MVRPDRIAGSAQGGAGSGDGIRARSQRLIGERREPVGRAHPVGCPLVIMHRYNHLVGFCPRRDDVATQTVEIVVVN